jgi:teichuronic acid biosynthesis glycosyltransferase TuaG
MNLKPFFSVIVPLYNSERFIEKAVISVIYQSFDNWELIIIEDGSSDNSLQLVQELQKKDTRIRVLQHELGNNKGVSASRNLGIKNSLGEWIAFLDADDIWCKHKLEQQYQIIQTNDSDLVFVYCKADFINQTGQTINADSSTRNINMKQFYGSGRPGLSIRPFKWVIEKGFEAPTSSVVAKKLILDKYNINFRGHLNFSEDGLFWYEVIKYGNIYFIDEPLLSYRIHKNQWNARTNRDIKIGRRFLAYSEMINPTFFEHKNLITFLLINKGFRQVVKYHLNLKTFQLSVISMYWKKVWNLNISVLHKLFSIAVLISEFFLMPLRWIKQIVSK